MRRAVIIAMIVPTRSARVQVKTSLVITSPTWRCITSIPSSAMAFMMPRSEMMPTMVAPSSEATNAPTRSTRIRRTASAIVASGRMVRTSLPLPVRIDSMFTGRPLLSRQ